MKKFISVLLLLSTAQSAFAKFSRVNSNDEIFAIEAGEKAYCVATRTDEGLKLHTEYAIEKPELRKAMRSTTYLNRTLLALPFQLVAWTTQVNMIGLVAIKTVDAAITSIYDDNSHYAYNFLSTLVLPNFLPAPSPNPFDLSSILEPQPTFLIFDLPVVGERVMRGRRVENFISSESYQINDKRFDKILYILPSLNTTEIKCDDVFSSLKELDSSIETIVGQSKSFELVDSESEMEVKELQEKLNSHLIRESNESLVDTFTGPLKEVMKQIENKSVPN